MGRSRWPAVGVVTATLVAAVLLVRPGTEATPTDLGLSGSDTPPPSPSGAATPSAVVTPERITRPLELSELTLEDLAPTRAGAGPLRLGADEQSLAAWGWTTRQGRDGCRRVREASTGTGDSLTGWVRDGRLVSVQVTAGGTRLDLPELRTGFGWAVEDVRTAQRISVSGGPDERVTTFTWQADDGVTVLASDLGTDGIRWVEVRLDDAAGCVLTPDVADGEVTQHEWQAYDAYADAGDEAVADLEGLLGEALTEVAAGEPGAVVDDADDSCRRSGLDGAAPEETGATYVDVEGGVVVRAGRTLTARDGDVRLRPSTAPVPGGSPDERATTRTSSVHSARFREDGLVVESEEALTAWVPPDVDAFAVTAPPVLRAVAVALDDGGTARGCGYAQLP